MFTRILSGLALIALVLAVLFWLPPAATALLGLVALVLATWEFVTIAEHGHDPLPRVLIIVAVATTLAAMALSPWWARFLPVELTVLAALLAVGAVAVGEGRTDRDVLRRVAVSLLPIVYLALPIGAMVVIHRDRGPAVLLLLVATTIASDTAQYFGGRALGRRPLSPVISPRKTVEGAVSGVVVGSLVLPIGGAYILPGEPWWVLWPAGFALTGLGIVGDLFESLLKRSVGVKDSSELIPGHGGVLDRIDSLLFAAPFYYALLHGMGR